MEKVGLINEYADILFKIGGLIIALYIAPIKKSIDGMSSEMKGLQDSVSKLNSNMAVMFEKHETKEREIVELQKDMRNVRDRLHDITNNGIGQIKLNDIRLSELEDRLKRGIK